TSVLVRLARRVYPVTDRLDGERFFTMEQGKRAATPLFVTLLLVDFADVVFAVDSIPAIFAVTQDPFIVFTSNAFAILGLRSPYFAIAGLMVMFKYIKFSLIFILAFVGVKMMLHHHVEVAHAVSLAIIVGFLAIGIVASPVSARRERVGSELRRAGTTKKKERIGEAEKRVFCFRFAFYVFFVVLFLLVFSGCQRSISLHAPLKQPSKVNRRLKWSF